MPLPTPTIVFAIATAIPFGLAIRDTATGKYHTLEDDRWAYHHQGRDYDGDEDADADDLEEYGRLQQQMQQQLEAQRLEDVRQLEAQRDKKRTLYRGLYGAEVASMGSLLAGIKLGGPKLDNEFPSALRDADLDPRYLDDGVTLYGIYLSVGTDSQCPELVSQLTTAWGEPTDVSSVAIWLNPTTGLRATVDARNLCELTFERVATMDTWLAKSRDAVVPMAVIGGSSKALTDRLGDRAEVDDDRVTWKGLGIGAGVEPTSLTAYIKGGKIVGLRATVKADDATQALVEARVTQLVGKKPENKTEDIPFEQTVWKTVPKITLDPTSGSFELRIGEQLDP